MYDMFIYNHIFYQPQVNSHFNLITVTLLFRLGVGAEPFPRAKGGTRIFYFPVQKGGPEKIGRQKKTDNPSSPGKK